jgi:hypothetical protein
VDNTDHTERIFEERRRKDFFTAEYADFTDKKRIINAAINVRVLSCVSVNSNEELFTTTINIR